MRFVVIGIVDAGTGALGVGPQVVRRLRVASPPRTDLVECGGDPAELIGLWAGRELAVVVGAVRGAGVVGEIYRLGLHHPAAAVARAQRFGAGVDAAVARARREGRMPDRLLLYGVRAAGALPQAGLTPAEQAATAQVVEEVLDLLDAAA